MGWLWKGPAYLAVGVVWLITLPVALIHEGAGKILDPQGDL